MDTQTRRLRGSTIVHLRKGTKATSIWASLKSSGAIRVELIVAGIVTRQKLQAALDNLELLLAFVDTRVMIDRKGCASIYPRPHCELDRSTLVINGELLPLRFRKNRLVLAGDDRLSTWIDVWPLLATHILDNRPNGAFIVS